MLYRKKPMVVDAVQITEAMFNTGKFPEGVVVRQMPWEGQYARELELKHGPLEVPFVIEPTGPERLTCGDWILKNESGERRRCQDKVFRELFEPVEEGKGVFCLDHRRVMVDGVCPKCKSA
jgi:hypothetical protein